MHDPQTGNGFTIRARNFGPIRRAEVDLRPLSVFVGPSNAGKSYLAVLIYALHRHFNAGALPRYGLPPQRPGRGGAGNGAWPELAAAALPELASAILEGGNGLRVDAHEGTPAQAVLPGEPVAKVLRAFLEQSAGSVAEEVGRCFGVPHTDLARRRSKITEFGLSRLGGATVPSLWHQVWFTAQRSDPEAETSFPAPKAVRIPLHGTNDPLLRFAERAQHDPVGSAGSLLLRRLLDVLMRRLLATAIAPLDAPAYYLPASRTGVMHAHTVVVSNLIRSAPMAGLREEPVGPAFSGVLADFLELLLHQGGRYPLAAGRRSGRGVSRFAGSIEKEILGGSIQVERSRLTGYPNFSYRPRETRSSVPLMAASSMVSELAPIVHHLREYVAAGDTFIVEEPESHLHPAMQVTFTRVLAELVEAGVRVILTTHSDWVLEELANIVERSKVPPQQRAADDPVALPEADVGAWLFDPAPNGSRVTRIDLDDSGLYPCGFREVGKRLQEDWDTTSQRLAEARLADAKGNAEPWEEVQRELVGRD